MTHIAVEHPSRRKLLKFARIALSIAIVIAIFALIIPKFANYSSVLGTVTKLTVLQILVVLGAMLFPLERRLVRKVRESPSTELMICRRPAVE